SVYRALQALHPFPTRRSSDLMDILFPGIGEIVGGSEREENLDILVQRMEELNIPQDELYWYLDIRKYGSCPHSGYGLGFERMVQDRKSTRLNSSHVKISYAVF